MHEVLDLMFPWGLSEALFHALEVIGAHIPPLLKIIQGESDRSVSALEADGQNVSWTLCQSFLLDHDTVRLAHRLPVEPPPRSSEISTSYRYVPALFQAT